MNQDIIALIESRITRAIENNDIQDLIYYQTLKEDYETDKLIRYFIRINVREGDMMNYLRRKKQRCAETLMRYRRIT